uniref:Uncharacterized protein n=1 Tax=Arundo donax TaxID=35708 RepID=A0A0A9H8Y8_ARUDO
MVRSRSIRPKATK